MTEKTENKTARQELSETVKRVLELITDETIHGFQQLSNNTLLIMILII